MKDEAREERWNLLWGLSAALILHALMLVLFVYGVSESPPKPQEEQAVNVALVPPPDQPKPKPAPEPPKKDTKAEKPPEQKVEKPPEQKAEKPPAPEKQEQKPPPIEVLKPVFQFGDKDTGPKKSLDGASAQDSSPSPAKNDNPQTPTVPKDAEDKPAAAANSEARPDATKAEEKPAAPAKDAEPAQEKPAPQDTNQQTAAAPEALAAAGGEIELPTTAQAPQPRPTNAPQPGPARAFRRGAGGAKAQSPTDAPVAASQGFSGLPGVRKLYSQGATGDASATSSMDGLSRDQRAAKLCSSVLEQEVMNASYFPTLIPSFTPKAGNVLDVPDTALPTATTVYKLSYRCEVDTNATRVLSFAFHVGTPIPPADWPSYGLTGRYQALLPKTGNRF